MRRVYVCIEVDCTYIYSSSIAFSYQYQQHINAHTHSNKRTLYTCMLFISCLLSIRSSVNNVRVYTYTWRIRCEHTRTRAPIHADTLTFICIARAHIHNATQINQQIPIILYIECIHTLKHTLNAIQINKWQNNKNRIRSRGCKHTRTVQTDRQTEGDRQKEIGIDCSGRDWCSIMLLNATVRHTHIILCTLLLLINNTHSNFLSIFKRKSHEWPLCWAELHRTAH